MSDWIRASGVLRRGEVWVASRRSPHSATSHVWQVTSACRQVRLEEA